MLCAVVILICLQGAFPQEPQKIGVLFLSSGVSEFHMQKAKDTLLKKLNEGSANHFALIAFPAELNLPLHQKDFSLAEAFLQRSGKYINSANFGEALSEADKGLDLVAGDSLFYDCHDLRVKLRVSRIQAALGLEKYDSLTKDLQELVNDKPDFQFDEKTFSPKELVEIKKVLADVIAPNYSILVKPALAKVEVIVDGKKLDLSEGNDEVAVLHLAHPKVHLSATKSGYLPWRQEILINGPETKVALDLINITPDTLLAPRIDRALEEGFFFSKLAQDRYGLLLISVERVGDSSVNFRGQMFKTKTATFSASVGVNYKKSFLLLEAMCSHFVRELKEKIL